MAISGTVTKIETRMVPTKYGVKPVYDLYVDNMKYGLGKASFKDPIKSGISVGASLQFESVPGKYGNEIVEGSIHVLSSGSGAGATPAVPKAAATAAAAPARSYDQGFPVPVTSTRSAS